MTACPCCGAELIGYKRIATLGKESLCIEVVLCCRHCQWQRASRKECLSPEEASFMSARDPAL